MALTVDRLGAVMLCCLVVGVLAACRPSSPPAPLPTIPPYPGVEKTDILAQSTSGSVSAETTTFNTTDSPADVLSFYRDELLARRWEERSEGLTGAEYTLIEGCQLSSLHITTGSDSAGKTTVKLELSSRFCD